jgi:hypothetical protein
MYPAAGVKKNRNAGRAAGRRPKDHDSTFVRWKASTDDLSAGVEQGDPSLEFHRRLAEMA